MTFRIATLPSPSVTTRLLAHPLRANTAKPQTQTVRFTSVNVALRKSWSHISDMHFDLQPVLKSELLELRPLRAEDFDDLFAVAADPLIWEQHPETDRYKEDQFRRFFAGAMESGGALVAIDTRKGQLIGSSRFNKYDAESSEVEIGWTFLGRSYWGGRYNGEMKRLMLEHAFQFVERVVFVIGPTNVRSQRAVEKIGAVRAGSRLTEGGRHSLVFEITPHAFRQQQHISDLRSKPSVDGPASRKLPR